MPRTKDMMLVEPGALIRRMFRDLDPWLETRGWFPPALRKSFGEFPWIPALEVTERDRTLFIKLDLPGLKKEDVQVEIDGDDLVIRGESKAESEIKDEDYYRSERSFGSFYRRMPLPAGVTAEQIQANLKDGVLEVRVPKPAEATSEAKKIEVK